MKSGNIGLMKWRHLLNVITTKFVILIVHLPVPKINSPGGADSASGGSGLTASVDLSSPNSPRGCQTGWPQASWEAVWH